MVNSKQLITKVDFARQYDLIQETIDDIFNLTKGFETQIKTELIQDGTTRFANNQITQHTDIDKLSVTVKLAKGKRVGSGYTSTITESYLEQFIKNLIQSIKNSPEISFYQGLPDPRKGDTFDGSGFNWSPEDRVQTIREAIKTGESIKSDINLSGTASENKTYKRIVSTNGIDVEDSYQTNYFKINAIAGKPDERGYGQEEIFWRSTEPDYTTMTQDAVNTAIKTIKFIDLPAPKDYEVILDSSAVGNMLLYMLISINPVDFHEGSSFASDRIGEKIFDENLSIDNLPRDPSQAIIVGSYDNEGIATKNVSLIDKGVLKHIPYNSFYASKFLQDKNLTTGSEFFSDEEPLPVSAVVKNGKKSLDDQIAEVKEGLLVKTFWYNRFTIKKEGGLTGLTRNGLFYIKDGEIKNAVRNLRYTESFVKAFGPDNIISIGNNSKNNSDSGWVNTPSFHLQKYHFSSVAHTFD